MPTLHSLSIRRRGTTTRTDKPSVPSATVSYTIKHLFTRKTDASHRKKDTNSAMGNAPSDMNATNGTQKQRGDPLARSSTSDRDSVRSRAMPGAEPPTPVPTSSPAIVPDQRSPEPDTVQVTGYDTDGVPHILNPTPAPDEDSKATELPDLEAGLLIPPIGTFDVLDLGQDSVLHQPQHHSTEEDGEQTTADVARTPRAGLKTEEVLAPLDLGEATCTHTVEASDATAVVHSPQTAAPSPPPGVWTPGTYVLLNARGGTALDLSGADHKAAIGYPMHGGANQQWEFIPSGHGYLIRCVRRSADGQALYLTVEGGLGDNAAIVASTYPVAWNIEPTEDGIRISWPHSDFVFDLADWGNGAPGTKVQLMRRKPGEACQHWHYTRCAPAAEHEKEHTVSRAFSPPATTETVTISEEHDFVTTTRTTTTTVLTTVTEVTRMPKSLLQQRQAQRRSITYR